MFKDVSDCLLAYKRELIAYLIWIDKNDKKYGEQKSHMNWGESDYVKTNNWNIKLRGMETVLNLKAEECEKMLVESKNIIARIKREGR